MAADWDLVVVGGGVAGLSAGLFARRCGLKTLLVDKQLPGGQLINAAVVEYFPGFPAGINGMELAMSLQEQCMKHGLEIVAAEAYGLSIGQPFVVKTTDGSWTASAVIVATGAEPRKLEVPGEEELAGRGVSYCASCDGHFFRDQVVAVVGGGDSALDEALSLTSVASRVKVIHRRRQLKACKSLQERALGHDKIEFIWDTVVERVEGKNAVEGLRLRNRETGAVQSLSVPGIFVYVGYRPASDFLGGVLKTTEDGYVTVSETMETSVRGIFAAGAVRAGTTGQVITAAADGAQAALSAEKLISGSS